MHNDDVVSPVEKKLDERSADEERSADDQYS
jgi:hypothetical protein